MGRYPLRRPEETLGQLPAQLVTAAIENVGPLLKYQTFQVQWSFLVTANETSLVSQNKMEGDHLLIQGVHLDCLQRSPDKRH